MMARLEVVPFPFLGGDFVTFLRHGRSDHLTSS